MANQFPWGGDQGRGNKVGECVHGDFSPVLIAVDIGNGGSDCTFKKIWVHVCES